MRTRVLAVLLAIASLAGACSDAPEPGDLAAFCSLLEIGTGLSSTATPTDFEQLRLVAPPEIRPTIDALRDRASDFDELLAAEPPDLEAIFNARFDPTGAQQRASLDDYAESSCGLQIARPAVTRWNNYVLENHAGAAWRDAVDTQFEVLPDRIEGATIVFGGMPAQMRQVEDVCEAVTDFLIADGSGEASVQILIGSAVALAYESADGVCQLP